MTDIPKWALEKALAAADDVHPHYPSCPNWTADEIMGSQGGVYRYQLIVRAFARYIAEHEEAPADPDMIAAREVVCDYHHDKHPESPWHVEQAEMVRSGRFDKMLDVQAAYHGIKRGRALERGE